MTKYYKNVGNDSPFREEVEKASKLVSIILNNSIFLYFFSKSSYQKKLYVNEMSQAALANIFPDAFSKIPDDFKYSNEVENAQNLSNIDDLEEKINEIDLSIQVSSKKKKRARSRSSFHSTSTRSSHSSKSSKTQNSDFTSNLLCQTTSSLSNLNFNTINSNVSPIKIKITHIVKRKKKSKKKPNKAQIKNYMKTPSPPKIQKAQSDEQKKPRYKKQLLPFSVLYIGYQIRFNYHPKDVIRTNESPGCPTVLTYRNGDVETRFNNGTSQIIHCHNKFTNFVNGDAQHEFPDGAVAYFYASNKTTEFIHPNGTRVLQFNNGQRYTYHPNVKIEITYHQANASCPPF